MNCSKARRWFGAYWDDEITQAEREWLEAHFATCGTCRAEYDQFVHTIEAVASLPRHEAAPDFVERTLTRARRAAPIADHLRAPRPMWAPVAAAATLLVVVGTLLAPWAGRIRPMASRPDAPHEATLLTRATPEAMVDPAAPATGVTAPRHVPSQEQVAAIVDSLIDHSEDVDFVLDPVQVSRDRTAGRKLKPVQSQRAVITF